MLEEGDAAPAVTLQKQDGSEVSPDWSGVTVVYFYPKDDTPGCTTEAQQFEEERDVYEDSDVTVYGVSTDTVDSHREFADDHGIGFDLLADPEGEVAEKFGVLDGDHAGRATFVVVDGDVQRVYDDVDPDGHAREVMLDLMESDSLDFEVDLGLDVDVDVDLEL